MMLSYALFLLWLSIQNKRCFPFEVNVRVVQGNIICSLIWIQGLFGLASHA